MTAGGLVFAVLAVLAFVLGIWLGLPGRYTQSADDIGRVMDSGLGRRRRTKRVFTPLAWLQRRASARAASDRRRGRQRGGFRMESPDDR